MRPSAVVAVCVCVSCAQALEVFIKETSHRDMAMFNNNVTRSVIR